MEKSPAGESSLTSGPPSCQSLLSSSPSDISPASPSSLLSLASYPFTAGNYSAAAAWSVRGEADHSRGRHMIH